MRRSRNLAARAGRFSARHRGRVIVGWLVFVVLAAVVGGSIGTKTLKQNESGVGESGRADKAISQNFPDRATEEVLVQSRAGAPVRDPRVRAAVADVVVRLHGVRYVSDIRSPYVRRNPGQISRDGRSALVRFHVAGDEDQAKKRVGAALDAVAAAQRAHTGLRIEEFGDASANKALSKAFEDDFRKAEVTSLPITLLILVVAFGALVAAGVPLLLAISAVAATIGLVGPISHIWAVDQSITSVVLLIGLAVGVDYSMFYLRREREERAAGRGEEAALEAAAATSGRAVLVSGITVMIAMAGMYIAGASTFQGFATGTILVVLIAVVGSVTVLPALLSVLGDRVNKGRVPFLTPPEKRTGESRVVGAVIDRVLRRPLIAGLLAVAFLVVLAVPALHIHTATSGVETLPRSLAVMRTYDRIQKAFPGGPLPATVAFQAKDVTAPQEVGAIRALVERASRSDLFKRPVTVDVSPNHRVAEISIPVAGDGTDARSNAALSELRSRLIPATLGLVPGAKAQVSGITASSKDFNDLMKARLPLVFAFVLGLAFVLLLVTFRSIAIPLKAIVLNALSVGAAYGILTWVFQDGHLQSVLGFHSNGAVTSWLPLFLFVALFGLSMDYHVFILTRIREGYDGGLSTSEAVGHGIKTTAVVVTSAAVVMVAVFSIFATLSALEFKEFGVGLAMAVLIDATIIRGILLPSAMKLLGDWNWYLPRALRWLPRTSSSERRPRPAEA
jgi:uncharacterized membrane protein YdfJ with MMPL/SSD domain